MRFTLVNSCYNSNKEVIEKYLCENISKPEIHCNGKCFLNKNLNKTKEEKSEKYIGAIYKLDLFQKLQPINIPKVSFVYNENHFNHVKNFYIRNVIDKPFRPPIY